MFRHINSFFGQLLVFVFLLVVWIYKFKEVHRDKTKYYSIKRMYSSGIILLILFLTLLLEGLESFGYPINISQTLGNIVLGFLLVLGIYFLLLGSFPNPVENKYKVEIDYPLVSRRGGFDVLDTAIKKRDDYLLLYKYFIAYDSIEVIENTPDRIVINAKTNTKKYGELPITARFYSKLSKKRISSYLKLNPKDIN